MVTREQIEVVVARIRPFIQNDGGDIELVDVIGNRARVRMSGNCVGCPSASMTLYVGLEWALKDVDLALGSAETTPLPLLAALSSQWHSAVNAGHGRRDISAAILALNSQT